MYNKNVYDKLNELGITLPEAPADTNHIVMIKPYGDHLLFLSGLGPGLSDGFKIFGKLPSDVSVQQGADAAGKVMLNALAVLHNYLKDLNRVKNIIKLTVFVASDPDFGQQPQVANGANQVLMDVFGTDIGRTARSAIGVAALPGNIPVEIEMIVEYE